MSFKDIFRSKYFSIITLLLVVALICNFYLFNAHKFGHSGLGQFGDLYGGVIGTIVSAITLFYLIITVEEIKTQNKHIRQQIEQSDFMMLLHNYHEIIEDLDFDLKNENNEIKQVLHGREAMKEILAGKNEIYKIKHIVETAVYILRFPQINNIDLHFESTNKKYFQNIFIPTLSDVEKIAIIKIKHNPFFNETNDLEKEFDAFLLSYNSD